MKELLSPYQIMELMVEKIRENYPGHDNKAEGTIQFYLNHKGENVYCYIKTDLNDVYLREGVVENPTATIKCSFYNWLALAGGSLNPFLAMITGKIRFGGKTSFFKVIPKKAIEKHIHIPEDPPTKFEKKPHKHWVKPKKIKILNASPRGKEGYTEFYLKPFIKGLSKESNVEMVYLKDYKINSCKGCFSCWMIHPGKCIYDEKDDYRQLAEKMSDVDLIVYAFPIYADGFPGILKNYLDRAVSRANPYLIDGIYKVRHPRNFIHKDQSMVVFSICGFFEMVSFKPVHAFFKEHAHNRHNPLVAEIYRTTAVGLHGNPFAFKILEQVYEALEKAGEEIVQYGKIKRKTNKIIRKGFPKKQKDLNKVNTWWHERKGCGDNDY